MSESTASPARRHLLRPRRALSVGCIAAAVAFALAGDAALAATPHWTLTSTPNNGAQSNVLNGVSCVSTSFCMAVGDYANPPDQRTLIEERNATGWHVVSSPSNGSQANFLQAVSCVSTSFCMAVGYYLNGSYYQTMIEKWNGSSWNLVGSPDNGNQYNWLYGVSCVSRSFCMATGGYYIGGTTDQTLIEEWNGIGWSLVSSPNGNNTQRNFLIGVSCKSTSFCVSAGAYYTGTNNNTLIETWNGTTWSVSSPNTGSQDFQFIGVSCASTSLCVAVGTSSNGASQQTLIEGWNGSAWSQMSSPNSGVQSNTLYDVRCPSTSFCMAVGWYSNGTSDQTLTEEWDGVSWRLVSSPNRSNQKNNNLYGVSCLSSSFCMAAGVYFDGSNNRTLAEKW